MQKRVYYLYDVPQEIERGKHAHYELEQVIFALNGTLCSQVLDLFDGLYQIIISSIWSVFNVY